MEIKNHTLVPTYYYYLPTYLQNIINRNNNYLFYLSCSTQRRRDRGTLFTRIVDGRTDYINIINKRYCYHIIILYVTRYSNYI